jgi:Zn-dependent protease/CBS domain-containing protein
MVSDDKALTRIQGIPVRADRSWFLVLLLLTWSFWSRFAGGQPHHSVGVAFLMAVVATSLFSASLLAHEAAHALEAKRRGIHVDGITLYLFGGATEIHPEDIRGPADELALTAAGPWTSIVLGCGFALIAFVAGRLQVSSVAQVFGELGWLSIILAVFNLLPGAPLDGGRMLEAVAWRVTGDRFKAMRVAATGGRLIGAVILAAGLFELFFVLGGLLGGLWLAFIGWYLIQAASAEESQADIRQALSDTPAGSILAPPLVIPPTMPLRQAVRDYFRAQHVDAVLLEGTDAPVGVLTLDDVLRLSPTDRAQLTAGAVARPLSDVPAVDAGEPALSALRYAGQGPVAVTRDGRVLGVLTPRGLRASAERARQLKRGRATLRGLTR